MTRFNYLGTPRQASFPPRMTLAIDNRIRGPLAALLATVGLCGALTIVQFERLRVAHGAYVSAALRLADDERELDRINALRARLRSQRQLTDVVIGIRRTSLLRANQLMWIGNRLPAQVWLHALRYENGTYSLDGTAGNTAVVGAAILALQDPARVFVPQLVSLRDDATAGTSGVHYTLRIQAPR